MGKQTKPVTQTWLGHCHNYSFTLSKLAPLYASTHWVFCHKNLVFMVPVTDNWCDLSLGGKRSLENTCLHVGVVNLKGWVSCMLFLVRTPGLRKASSAGRGLNRVHVFISRTVIKPTTCVPVSLHFPNAAHTIGFGGYDLASALRCWNPRGLLCNEGYNSYWLYWRFILWLIHALTHTHTHDMHAFLYTDAWTRTHTHREGKTESL